MLSRGLRREVALENAMIKQRRGFKSLISMPGLKGSV